LPENVLLLILKPSSYLKFKIFMLLRRDLPGSMSTLAAVLPTSFENFLPDQLNPSAAGEKNWPHTKFTHRGQYVLQPKFQPLGNTAYQAIDCSSASSCSWRKRMLPRAK
jgi:hypothetical protein